MSCYEQTLWVSSFPEPFEALIEQVYRSDKDDYAFRRDWLADCVGKPL